MDLTKQIHKSHNWIITAQMIMFQLATTQLTLTDGVRSFSFLKEPCQKTSSGHGKGVNQFNGGQFIGMHQTKQMSKNIAKTTQIGLRTANALLKNENIVGTIVFEE